MENLLPLAEKIAARLIERKETIAVAEGSAGGLISAALLAVPGASAYFVGGAVVYTGAARSAASRSMGRVAILRDAVLRTAPQDEIGMCCNPLISCRAVSTSLTASQATSLRPHAEERTKCASRSMGCVAILRDAVLRTAPQDEAGVCCSPLI